MSVILSKLWSQDIEPPRRRRLNDQRHAQDDLQRAAQSHHRVDAIPIENGGLASTNRGRPAISRTDRQEGVATART
jgi:hypothetical protein